MKIPEIMNQTGLDGFLPSPSNSMWLFGWTAWFISSRSPNIDTLDPIISRQFGNYDIGTQILAGEHFNGSSDQDHSESNFWNLQNVGVDVVDRMHGFTWLEDLLSLHDKRSSECAEQWTQSWIQSYGNGNGPGWRPETTARRLIWWIRNYWIMRSHWQNEILDLVNRSISRQSRYLSIWKVFTRSQFSRLQIDTSLLLVALFQNYVDRIIKVRIASFTQSLTNIVNEYGEVPSRNPMELLQIGFYLNLVLQALKDLDAPIPDRLSESAHHIAETLLSLNTSDQSLCYYYGDRYAPLGMIPATIVGLSPGIPVIRQKAMGYTSVRAGLACLTLNDTIPPKWRSEDKSLESFSAIEFSSGNVPIIVNNCSGTPVQNSTTKQTSLTGVHSSLEISNHDSSENGNTHKKRLLDIYKTRQASEFIQTNSWKSQFGTTIHVSHEGYKSKYGVLHHRILQLKHDGTELRCNDIIEFVDDVDSSIAFRLNFYLHPEVSVENKPSENSVRLDLSNGESWRFTFFGRYMLRLDERVDISECTGIIQVPLQIVIDGKTTDRSTNLEWALEQLF